MYRFLLRSLCTAPNSSVGVYESCKLLTKCDAAPLFRVANGGGVRALSSSSVTHCEKKADVASSNQVDKIVAEENGKPTETPTLVTQTAEDTSKVIKEEPVVLKTDDGSSTQQGEDIQTEPVVAAPKIVQTDAANSMKNSLLDLLGTMTVEVTNKRTLKKVKQSDQPHRNSKSADRSGAFKEIGQDASPSETLDRELISAAFAAASTLPNQSQAESALLRQLRQNKTLTESQKKGDMHNLGVIIANMKVGKKSNRHGSSLGDQLDDDMGGNTQARGITAELNSVRRRKGLFTTKRLNIFSTTTDEDSVELAAARPTLWDMDFANKLSDTVNLMPRNGLDEMIQWTKEGKLWQYPINNEAGLEEEANVSFYEHIFLENHLEEGFPRQGPVRHFMELVVTGLSKNPYLTAQQKKDHISWFRDYFQQKEEVLKEAEVQLN